ncbi:MAG TPA: hypothetical protein VIU63_04705 [Nitrospira sp.]
MLTERTQGLVLCTIVLVSVIPSVAQYYDIPTTKDLDPAHVQLVVHTDSRFLKQFSTLAIQDLKKAGIDVTYSDTDSVEEPAKLLLTLKQDALNDNCPGNVSYTATLALIEDVIIERSGEVIKDSTWLSTQAPSVRRLVTVQDMERDLHEMIARFIINFKLGNPENSPPGIDRKIIETDKKKSVKAQSRVTLRNLNLEQVNFFLWAGASTRELHNHVLKAAATEGIKLRSVSIGNSPELSLRLDYEKLDKLCPGKGIYSAKLELAELVRIQRPPSVAYWTTTWSREHARVSDPPSKEQFQRDSDDLLDEFIASYKSDNVR